MEAIRVWTKQHKNVWRILNETGRYTAKRRYIQNDLGKDAEIMIRVYDWLTANGPDAKNRPADAECPVWLSFEKEAAMLPSEDCVILELEIDPVLITRVNIMKWGAMLNYSYIPADAADDARHKKLLEDYHTNDATAWMTQFYPQIKREITESWKRLFDPAVSLGNDLAYGNVWELRKEWVTDVWE